LTYVNIILYMLYYFYILQPAAVGQDT
jgi:hypothetical protein